MKEQLLDNKLKEFFKNKKTEIDDNGFSNKVLRKLPESHSYNYIINLSLFAGLLVFVFSGGYQATMNLFLSFLNSISYFYMPSVESAVASLTLCVVILVVIRSIFEESVI
jgi:polyferredoxin